jgi:hypothetical protein
VEVSSGWAVALSPDAGVLPMGLKKAAVQAEGRGVLMGRTDGVWRNHSSALSVLAPQSDLTGQPPT